MSAGLRGAERVRRVRREECGGGMLWVWRLLGRGVLLAPAILMAV